MRVRAEVAGKGNLGKCGGTCEEAARRDLEHVGKEERSSGFFEKYRCNQIRMEKWGNGLVESKNTESSV